MPCGPSVAVRAVLDTNTVLSALLFGGPPRQLLDLGRTDGLSLFTSDVLLAELEDVLGRAKFARRLAAALPPDTPTSVVQRYAALATIVVPVPIGRTVPTDADDDAVIATALAADAVLIVTGDSDLLVLHPFGGIAIRQAADALEAIRAEGDHRTEARLTP